MTPRFFAISSKKVAITGAPPLITRVPLGRLKDGDGVVREMEEDNESPVHVDGSRGIHSGNKPQDIAVQSVAVLLHELFKVPKYRQTKYLIHSYYMSPQSHCAYVDSVSSANCLKFAT